MLVEVLSSNDDFIGNIKFATSGLHNYLINPDKINASQSFAIMTELQDPTGNDFCSPSVSLSLFLFGKSKHTWCEAATKIVLI